MTVKVGFLSDMIGNKIVGFHMQRLRAYHYQNLPMQYTDIFFFSGVKIEEKIRRKNYL